jgi:Golgi nucleoside diphosphatase
MTLEIRAEDIRQDTPSAYTTPKQFKVIDDVKDEPTLKSAQEFVGGSCGRHIYSRTGITMIINEEGKLIGLAFEC